MDDVGETAPRSSGAVAGPAPDRADRLEALEHQVRQLTSRLAGWVEAQLVQALDDRREDMKALRSELLAVVNEQLAGVRAESASVLSVTTRRLEVAQEQLRDRVDTLAERSSSAPGGAGTHASDVERRLDEVAAQAAAAADAVAALRAGAGAGPLRVEAFEQRVKAAIGRLSDSVEARFADTGAQHDAALDAARAEMLARVDEVQGDARRAGEAAAAAQAAVAAGGQQVEALARQLAAVARLGDSMETRTSELAAAQEAGLAAARIEWIAAIEALGGRLDATDAATGAVVADVAALRADGEAAGERTVELERRVKAAVARLADSVETRLAEAAKVGSAEAEAFRTELRAELAAEAAELRAEVETSAAAVRSRFAQVQDRLDAAERAQREAAEGAGALVEEKVAPAVERQRAELEEAVATQLRDGRAQVATLVADTHRRFVVSVDELRERLDVVAEQAAAAWTAASGLDAVQETVASDGRRIEALEVHTRRTDARLGDVVDAKLAEVAGRREAELEQVRDEMRAAVAGVPVQLRAALVAHLAETREEVARAVADARVELGSAAAELDLRQVGLEALAASLDDTLHAAEDRLIERVGVTLAEIRAAAGGVANARAEMDTMATALDRRMARAQTQLNKKLGDVADQVDLLVKAAAGEAGALAPMRSDVRTLQTQVAELTELVADLRPKRKAPAPAKKVAVAKKVAPAKKAAAAKKAVPAAGRRKAQ